VVPRKKFLYSDRHDVHILEITTCISSTHSAENGSHARITTRRSGTPCYVSPPPLSHSSPRPSCQPGHWTRLLNTALPSMFSDVNTNDLIYDASTGPAGLSLRTTSTM